MQPDVVELGAFARAWAVEGRRVAWLLGAGASASAGVPTAAQIVDDLLLRLYAAAHRLVRQAIELTDPAPEKTALAGKRELCRVAGD